MTSEPTHEVSRRIHPRRRSGRWATVRALGLLLPVTWVMLGVMRLALLRIPFRRIAAWLGPADVESPREISEAHRREAERVAHALRVAHRRTPWTSNCLPQALTGCWLLRRRGISCTLYLGAMFSDDHAGLQAHAWLRCGDFDVCGGAGADAYGVLARFGAAVDARR